MAKALLAAMAALVLFAGVASAQSTAAVTLEFDNRGSKTMSPDVTKKIITALSKNVFLTQSPSQVTMVGGMGQSSLFDHKSTVVYVASGPTVNGKSVLTNCQSAVKSGWFSKAAVEKSVKKATDSWWPGDSVKVKSAKCSAPQSGH